MKRLLVLLVALACRNPLAPEVPNVAGVWRLDGFVRDSVTTCRFDSINLYISQPTDSVSSDSLPFSGQTANGIYACTTGMVIPFPPLYVGGEVYANQNITFQLVPYLTFGGHLAGDLMSGTVQFGVGPAVGTWTARRITP